VCGKPNTGPSETRCPRPGIHQHALGHGRGYRGPCARNQSSKCLPRCRSVRPRARRPGQAETSCRFGTIPSSRI
jgi:hypothetical protein